MTRLIALIPAYNEESTIGACLTALFGQTRPADRVIVIADNCTDGTAAVAAAAGAEVYATRRNTTRKAGALNQVLALLLPTLEATDRVLVLDADSELDPGFLAGVDTAFTRRPDLGGVGGTFRGAAGGGFVGWAQRNEYARHGRDVRRLKGRCLVLTGTAAVFPVSALRAVTGARGRTLPGRAGAVYDTTVLTEDNELTLALMHLGYQVLSPRECTLTTEIMPTWVALAGQRLRWKRGAIENLVQYGLTRVTWRYWGRQVLSAAGVLVTAVYLASLAWGAATGMTVHPFWMAVTALFAVERVVTVRDRGWRQQLIAVLVVVEMAYDVFLQGVQAKAYADAVLGRARDW